MKLNSEEIMTLLAEKNMNISDFSKKSGINRSWLSKVLNRGYGNNKIINRIAQHLDVELRDIVIFKDQLNNEEKGE